jgi:copper chaperone NosL
MLVSEPAFAAAYRVDGVEPRVFDDVGCLLEALVEEERSPSLRVWFHDFESGSWIDAGEASFVSESEIETPMGGGIVAFADPVRAERTASSRNGRFVESFEALLASEMAKR